MFFPYNLKFLKIKCKIVLSLFTEKPHIFMRHISPLVLCPDCDIMCKASLPSSYK